MQAIKMLRERFQYVKENHPKLLVAALLGDVALAALVAFIVHVVFF